ncbi:MAG TPA: response regulator transcription factor [Gemmataceae bacterium]|nr:response regulator transcription factor [Gemmataceae bacterium]
MKPIRVILVDDHDLVRAGLRALLQKIAGISVVAEAADGHEAIALLADCPCDVVLMDITMAGLNGFEATERIVKKHPDVRVVALSMHAAEEFVLKAVRAGASGYLVKNARIAELEQAVRAVADGQIYLSPTIAGHVLEACRRVSEVEKNPLTTRQREVLQLVAEGHSTKQIASRLGISVKTVEMYRGQIMEALHIHDIAGLTRYAIRTGMVSAEA